MDHKNNHYLPDFCSAEVVLKMILMVEFTAITFAILTINDFSTIYNHTGLISLFMLFIVLSSTMTLCLLNKVGYLTNHSSITAITLTVFSFYTITFTLWIFSQNWFAVFFKVQPEDLWFNVIKFEIIALICLSVGLRYLFVQYESEQRLIIQSKARLQALQARIRPHFFFNSMNTIASLIYDSPEQAEQATINLSHLFRASLSDVNLIPLQQEIKLTKDYIELEHLRLEDRLKVEWKCVNSDLEFLIPPLTLQPLVENAIYHGIEPMVDGGTIEISSCLKNNTSLLITISNPLLRSSEKKEGNKMALDNIKERLKIAFKGRSKFSIKQTDTSFCIEFTLPASEG